MQAILKTVIDDIREDFGHPVRLVRLLAQHPGIRVALDMPRPCIDAQSVVRWDKLGRSPHTSWPRRERGRLLGWKLHGRHSYQSFEMYRPEFEEIDRCETTPDWSCDIADIHGFSGSKSELRDFVSTDEMVEANSRDMIDEITHQKLAENLAHDEIRIIHRATTTDHFGRYLWDNRLFLMNDGGSHHLAAAKYIAVRLSQPVPLRGTLYTYSLNELAINSLRRDFEMFAISNETSALLDFHQAMESFRATWLWHHLPRPFENAKAVLLPRDESRSMRVAGLLREVGVVDLGAHLAGVVSQQLRD